MNYLAHAYLSFGQPPLLVGNMISDYIKGKTQYNYPEDIQQGIRLHRAIDTFTDSHDATHQAKEYFKKDYRLYAGAMVDVVYDHYLANDTHYFISDEALQQTASFTYTTLAQNQEWLPEKFSPMLPYMTAQNWLYNYRFTSGIEKSLMGVVRRSAYLTDASMAYASFLEHYDALKICFEAFFPEMVAEAKKIVGITN